MTPLVLGSVGMDRDSLPYRSPNPVVDYGAILLRPPLSPKRLSISSRWLLMI